MLNNKFFRGIKEKLFGIQKRGGNFDSERAMLIDFDRFINMVMTVVVDFHGTLDTLATLHNPLFDLCENMYPPATESRMHIVAIKDLLQIYDSKKQKAELHLFHFKDAVQAAIDRNQAVFRALDEIDKLQHMVEHYDKKLQKLNGQFHDAQVKNDQKRVSMLAEKTERNEKKRADQKFRLEKVERDVNFDIHDIVANRIRSCNYFVSELAELYAQSFEGLNQACDLLRDQSVSLKAMANREEETDRPNNFEPSKTLHTPNTQTNNNTGTLNGGAGGGNVNFPSGGPTNATSRFSSPSPNSRFDDVDIGSPKSMGGSQGGPGNGRVPSNPTNVNGRVPSNPTTSANGYGQPGGGGGQNNQYSGATGSNQGPPGEGYNQNNSQYGGPGGHPPGSYNTGFHPPPNSMGGGASSSRQQSPETPFSPPSRSQQERVRSHVDNFGGFDTDAYANNMSPHSGPSPQNSGYSHNIYPPPGGGQRTPQPPPPPGGGYGTAPPAGAHGGYGRQGSSGIPPGAIPGNYQQENNTQNHSGTASSPAESYQANTNPLTGVFKAMPSMPSSMPSAKKKKKKKETDWGGF